MKIETKELIGTWIGKSTERVPKGSPNPPRYMFLSSDGSYTISRDDEKNIVYSAKWEFDEEKSSLFLDGRFAGEVERKEGMLFLASYGINYCLAVEN